LFGTAVKWSRRAAAFRCFMVAQIKVIMERGGGGIIIRVNPVFLVVGNGAIIKFSLNVRNTVTMIII
jgi:hypothetical protein